MLKLIEKEAETIRVQNLKDEFSILLNPIVNNVIATQKKYRYALKAW